MEWIDKGIVLARGTFREADMWLRLLFRHHGVQSVFAFGGQHSRRRFVGCLDLLNELECSVKSSRTGQYLELCEASLVQGPGLLRTRRKELGLCVNCMKLVDSIGVPQEAAAGVFSLLHDLIQALGEPVGKPLITGLLFRLRVLDLLGYTPVFSSCLSCRKKRTGGAFFSIEEGGVFCLACAAKRNLNGARFAGASLDTLESAMQSPPRAWADVDFPQAELRKVACCVDGMLRYHAGLAWEKGRYCRI